MHSSRCFFCGEEASERVTLAIKDSVVVNDGWTCEGCLSDFQDVEWTGTDGASVSTGGDDTDDETGSERGLLRPDVNRIFDTLQDQNRRLVLLLMRHGAVETEADLRRRGTMSDDDAGVALSHVHLPKLDDTGYIEWDRDTGAISEGPRFDEVEAFLDLFEEWNPEPPAGWP